jgi:hypothetical protein
MRAAIAVAVLLVVGAIVWVLVRPPERSEEDRVRDVIEQIAAGARGHDLDATFEPISQRYTHEELTRPQLKAYVFSQFQKHKTLSIALGPIAVQFPSQGHASADFEAAIAEGIELTTLNLVPDQADVYDFHVELEDEDGEWMVVGHEQRSKTGSRDRIVPP